MKEKFYEVFKTISSDGEELLHKKIMKELADGWHLYKPGAITDNGGEINEADKSKISMTLVKKVKKVA